MNHCTCAMDARDPMCPQHGMFATFFGGGQIFVDMSDMLATTTFSDPVPATPEEIGMADDPAMDPEPIDAMSGLEVATEVIERMENAVDMQMEFAIRAILDGRSATEVAEAMGRTVTRDFANDLCSYLYRRVASS